MSSGWSAVADASSANMSASSRRRRDHVGRPYVYSAGYSVSVEDHCGCASNAPHTPFLDEQVDHGVVWNSSSFHIGDCCLAGEGEPDARGTMQCVGGQRKRDADGCNDPRKEATVLTEVNKLGLTCSDWAAGSCLWTGQHLIEGVLSRHVESRV